VDLRSPFVPIIILKRVQSYNQLNYVEETKETDGKVWEVVLNRLLVATVLMQLLMILSRSSPLIPASSKIDIDRRVAIALKTQSYRMTMFAAVPISFIALLKWSSRLYHLLVRVIMCRSNQTSSGKDTSDNLALHFDYPELRRKPAPVFEHYLLREDWAPEFHWLPEDEVEFEKAKAHKQIGPALVELFYGTKGNSERRKRKDKLGEKEKHGEKGKHGEKEKLRENEKKSSEKKKYSEKKYSEKRKYGEKGKKHSEKEKYG